MSKLIIKGWKPLSWTVTPVANKNSIIKLIPAALLTNQDVTISNVPQTSDVKYMLEILETLWGTYKRTNEDTVTINCAHINNHIIDPHLSEKMKASVMFAGPLLARLGKVSMPLPQWCKLGTRPMDVFIENMVAMNCTYSYDHWAYDLETTWVQSTTVRQWFPSVTGTENLILMAVIAQWTTTIYNAWSEPHTQDLCNMLVSMGAQIEWIWSNKLIIHGVEKLNWTERTVISDHLDVAGIITATIMTGGEVTIDNAVVEHMWLILQAMEKLWIRLNVDRKNDTIIIPKQDIPKISRTIKWDYLELSAWPWPLLPMDLMPVLLVLAMHCDGSAIIHNAYYTTQFFFVQELAKMKWRTVMADPHRIITFWPTERKAANMICGDIIQSSYGMLMACLAAKWTSTLNAITPLFRRFPNLVEQFNALWADIRLE